MARRWLFPARLPDVRDRREPAYDGDTLWLQLDLGLDEHPVHPLRLQGVFAPELHQPGGVECRTFVRLWLEAMTAPVAGRSMAWPFEVETFKTRAGTDVETLGRYVAVVVGDPELVSLNRAVRDYVAANSWAGGVGA